MPLLPGAKERADQRQQAAFRRQSLPDRHRIPLPLGDADISEIRAQGVDLPVLQLAYARPEHPRPFGDDGTIARLPVVQVVDRPGQAGQGASWRAYLHGVEHLVQLRPDPGAADHGADAVAGDAVGFGEGI